MALLCGALLAGSPYSSPHISTYAFLSCVVSSSLSSVSLYPPPLHTHHFFIFLSFPPFLHAASMMERVIQLGIEHTELQCSLNRSSEKPRNSLPKDSVCLFNWLESPCAYTHTHTHLFTFTICTHPNKQIQPLGFQLKVSLKYMWRNVKTMFIESISITDQTSKLK